MSDNGFKSQPNPAPQFPEAAPRNKVMNGEGFHVSYLGYSTDYGSTTTCIVANNHEIFYTLNGDHRTALAELVPQGLDACMQYFLDHFDQVNFRSGWPSSSIATKAYDHTDHAFKKALARSVARAEAEAEEKARKEKEDREYREARAMVSGITLPGFGSGQGLVAIKTVVGGN